MNTLKNRRFVTIIFDRELRSVLQEFIREDGFEVETASDGLDAFHRLAKKYFDLIITDFQMPGLGGVQFLPRLKRIQPWARVIAIPTRRMPRKERQVVLAASDACLEKPFEMNQLKAMIQKMFTAADRKVVAAEADWPSGDLSLETGWKAAR